jgi:hypothetical protein
LGKPKHPASKIIPATAKIPRTAIDPDDFYRQRPAWRVALLQMATPYGWHEITPETLTDVRSKLASFESMTWKEILLDGKKAHHAVKVHRLCGTAQAQLGQIFGAIDVDQLVSLRLGSKERVWGVLDGATLKVLWWDPDHEVCPSLLKNT